MISFLGFILGLIFLIIGIAMYAYSEQYYWLYVWHPFRDYAVPLIVFGVALLVVGFVTGERAKEEKRLELEEEEEKARPITEIVYCSHCGTQNIKDAVYCKKCEKKIF